jgi:hypothetical protein
MADKKITLNIGGQEVVCNFGVNYFYKHFKEISGIDMLVDGLKGIETTKMFDIIPALYFAGYKAECSINKKDSTVPYEDFQFHVMSTDEAAAAKMITDYLNLLTTVDEKKTELQTASP